MEVKKKNPVSAVALEKLQEALYSAESLFGKNHFIQAEFREYAGLKARVEMRGGKITAKVSDGFENAEREVLVGLGITLFNGLFEKKIDNAYTRAYKEYSTRESSSSYHETLRKLRGREKKLEPRGAHHDLQAILDTIMVLYAEVFSGFNKPEIGWSGKKNRCILGFHDGAFNAITINRVLDSERVPLFVVQYIVFHELLHCKHKVLFQRGESLRRTVHPRAFKEDEKKFVLADKAEAWLHRSL